MLLSAASENPDFYGGPFRAAASENRAIFYGEPLSVAASENRFLLAVHSPSPLVTFLVAVFAYDRQRKL